MNTRVDRYGRWLAIGGFAAAVATILVSIFVMGTPAEQRRQRIDAHRVADLERVMRQVRAYEKTHRALPRDLATLDAEPGVRIPKDPENGAPYEYMPLDGNRFQLCATFLTATDAGKSDYGYTHLEEEWPHPVGRHCFTRNTDAPRTP